MLHKARQSAFRSPVELQQATKWLHDNGTAIDEKNTNDSYRSVILGILVHFDDTLLSNSYFLDPQYLAELLSQIIATEQTTGLARHSNRENQC